MIHTADYYADKYYQNGMHWKSVNRNEIIKAINEARIDSIKECAEISRVFCHNKDSNEEHFSVDKQSILKLIDQIK